jgi:acyl carrier protein
MSPSLPDRLRRLLLDDLIRVEVPSTDTDLFELALLDSLQFVQLLTLLQQHFGARFSTEDLEIDNLRSMARIASLLDHLQGRPAAQGLNALTSTDARTPKP